MADSNAALEKLKTIIQERLGDSMGISEARGDTTAVPRTAAPSVYSGKGKASVDGQSAAAPERDDDSHYFEASRTHGIPSALELTLWRFYRATHTMVRALRLWYDCHVTDH